MPRFYFDTVVNREIAYDDAGLEFASLDEGRQEACPPPPKLQRTWPTLADKGISMYG
jgi:hypothetical protein